MKRHLLLSIIFIATAFTVMQPKPAAACPGIIQPLCQIIGDADIARAVSSRIRIYLDTFLLELKIESKRKNAIAQSVTEQMAAKRSAMERTQRDIQRGPGPASCAFVSATQAVVGKPVGATNTEVPPSLGGGTAAAPAPAAVPSSRKSDGSSQPVGDALAKTDTTNNDYETTQRQLLSDWSRADAERNANLTPESQDQWRDTVTQYNNFVNNYGADQPLMQFRSASVIARTLLNYDTFPSDANTPKNAVAGTKPKTMLDAARDFCTNLIDPTISAPNRGAAVTQNDERQDYANKRRGWDARLNLAKTMCNESIARRAGINAGSRNQWLSNTVKEYRQVWCMGDKAALGCSTLNNDDITKLKISEYEAMKTLYTRLATTKNMASAQGAAGNSDATKMLVQLEEMGVALNFRIYEMQEKLLLLRSAQLANTVDSTKSSPDGVVGE